MKKVQEILGGRILTTSLLLLLMAILLIGYGLLRTTVFANKESISSRVVYLVPDERSMDSQLTSSNLIKGNRPEIAKLKVSEARQWGDVMTLVKNNEVDAVIIHHKMFDSVKPEELKEVFTNNKVVVAGVGIPGAELARAIGNPSLFSQTWPKDFGYTTQNYFFLYAYTVSGDARDENKVSAAQILQGKHSENVKAPLTVSVSASTGSLSEDPDSLEIMLASRLLQRQELQINEME